MAQLQQPGGQRWGSIVSSGGRWRRDGRAGGRRSGAEEQPVQAIYICTDVRQSRRRPRRAGRGGAGGGGSNAFRHGGAGRAGGASRQTRRGTLARRGPPSAAALPPLAVARELHHVVVLLLLLPRQVVFLRAQHQLRDAAEHLRRSDRPQTRGRPAARRLPPGRLSTSLAHCLYVRKPLRGGGGG